MSWVLVHGSDRQTLAPNDRAALYGDALFETLLWAQTHLVLAPLHWQRLLSGAARLQITLDPQVLQAFVTDIEATLTTQASDKFCAVRVSVHRSVDARGYAFSDQTTPELVCLINTAPMSSPRPVDLGVSPIHLARQPLLAGLKHANRLEQVMASQSLADQGYEDGLMCLETGPVVCTTRANVYALIDDIWHTPLLNDAGVAGTRRAWFLQQSEQGYWQTKESELTLDQLYHADAVMISNALRGFQEVGSIAGRPLRSSPQIARVKQRYADALAPEAC